MSSLVEIVISICKNVFKENGIFINFFLKRTSWTVFLDHQCLQAFLLNELSMIEIMNSFYMEVSKWREI